MNTARFGHHGTAVAGGMWPPLRLVERNYTVLRLGRWMAVFSGFFEPVIYLLGIGYGVGTLVGAVSGDAGGRLTYAQFVAPALMATSAMNGGIFESTMNFFYKIKYSRLYDVILSTPLSARDIATAEIAWAVLRGAVYAVGYLVVMAALGLVESWWALLAIPGAVLIVLAFASCGAAATTYVRTWGDLEALQLVLLPLFLFSTTFYPLTVYPGSIQVVVQFTPLYRGIHLLRALVTGHPTAACLLDVVYLAVMGGVGIVIAQVRLERRLRR